MAVRAPYTLRGFALGPGLLAYLTRQASEPAKIYAERDRRVSYLGDWHTHPTARPIPSFRDLETLGVIAAYSPARCPEPLMAILGKEALETLDQHWEIAVCQHVAAGADPANRCTGHVRSVPRAGNAHQ